MPNILVVDDELSIRESFSLILEGTYNLKLAASGEAALKIISDQKIDLAYLDIRMPGLNGLETLKRMKEIDPHLEIIMVTAVNDIQKASEAIKLGAQDYVVKPFEVNQILKLSEQTIRKKSVLEVGASAYNLQIKNKAQLLGQNEKIIEIRESIENIKNNQPVLILGEIGTEKQEVAQLIHQKSSRKDFPFKTIFLSQTMSANKIKTLLLGREKGASTVELKAESGLLEQTKEGTLFIDNLECLPEEVFKILSSSEFSRIGGSSKTPLLSRLVGGGPANLLEQNQTAFDFFSASVLIKIPPLCQRTSDIPILVNNFIEQFSGQYHKEIKISPAALEALTNHAWPGNTKELKTVIERFFLNPGTSQINLEDLPFDVLLNGFESTGSNLPASFEKKYIQRVFEEQGGDKEKTASLLGIHKTLLETKL